MIVIGALIRRNSALLEKEALKRRLLIGRNSCAEANNNVKLNSIYRKGKKRNSSKTEVYLLNKPVLHDNNKNKRCKIHH